MWFKIDCDTPVLDLSNEKKACTSGLFRLETTVRSLMLFFSMNYADLERMMFFMPLAAFMVFFFCCGLISIFRFSSMEKYIA